MIVIQGIFSAQSLGENTTELQYSNLVQFQMFDA